MAFTVTDRTKETSSTTGTGSITLGGAPTNYQTFNTAIGVNGYTWYCINNLAANEWEVGYGQLTGATTLARLSVLTSTNANALVSFSAGTKEVFVTLPSAFNAQTLGRTNMIINPYGSIQQESTAAQSLPAGVAYFADQWFGSGVASGAAAQVQATTGTVSAYDPYLMYLKTNTLKASLAAGDYMTLAQPIEGNYIRRLLYGGASAKSTWLRWRASASQSGTASVWIRNGANNRSFVQAFAVTTTPTDFFLLVPGDTTGTWVTDNTVGASVGFTHAAGTTFQTSTLGAWQAGNFFAANTQSNMLDTTNRQLNITDVQWSQSSVLLPFEPIDYQQELARSMRYFQALGQVFPNGYGNTGASIFNHNLLPVVMRASPTVTLGQIANANGSSVATDSQGPTFVRVQATVTSGPANAWSAASANLNARM